MSFSSLADRIVCINLRERVDRYELCKQRFQEVGLCCIQDDDDDDNDDTNKNNSNNNDGTNNNSNNNDDNNNDDNKNKENNYVQFLHVERHCKGGVYGCYDSHRTVIQQAYKDGLNSVLIFEDDVEFVSPGWEQVVKDVNDFLTYNNEQQQQQPPPKKNSYDAIMLGASIKYVQNKNIFSNPITTTTTVPSSTTTTSSSSSTCLPIPSLSSFISKIWHVKCIYAHAYIVSRQGMESFLNASPLFEVQLNEFPQDVIQNSVWSTILTHCNSSSFIKQDNNLGTDLHWLPDIPPAYNPWFQNTLVPALDSFLHPMITSTTTTSTTTCQASQPQQQPQQQPQPQKSLVLESSLESSSSSMILQMNWLGRILFGGKLGFWLWSKVWVEWYGKGWNTIPYIGTHYVLGLDHSIIDDGQIKLIGLWYIDTIIIIIIMIVHTPPFGYLQLYIDFCKMFPKSIVRRLQMKKNRYETYDTTLYSSSSSIAAIPKRTTKISINNNKNHNKQ